jgi:hypothetical protein
MSYVGPNRIMARFGAHRPASQDSRKKPHLIANDDTTLRVIDPS